MCLFNRGGVEMKFCPNCNLEYEAKYAFCNKCGSKLQEKIEHNFCPYCGNKVETDGEYCPFCGNSLKETDAVSVNDNINASNDKPFNTTNNETVSPKYTIKHENVTQKKLGYEVKDSEEPFFSKQHLFTYDGRRGRMSYLSVQVFWSIITNILTLFLTPVVVALGDIGLLLAFIIDCVLGYPMFCNTARRMHDLDWPTSWAVVLSILAIIIQYGFSMTKSLSGSNNSVLYLKWIIVIALFIPLVFLFFKKGTEGPNQYGPDSV